MKVRKSMNIPPVSFGSLMVFTINDDKPKASIPQLLRISFNNNRSLKNYNLVDTFEKYGDVVDGTVHNAAQNFAETLDRKYKSILPKGSKDVILTQAEFTINPRETRTRYFLTAATNDDEERIHNILSKSSVYYTAKFRNKR